MPTRRIETAPELIAEGKRLYEETDTPLHVIAERMGLTRRTLNNRIVEWNWTRRRYSVASAPLPAGPDQSSAGDDDSGAATEESPMPFAARMQRVIDAQLSLIERTLKVMGPANSAEAERTARTLAAVSRAVQKIKATAEQQTPADATDNDPASIDIDEFREELARRIHAFVDARQGLSGGTDDEAAAGINRGET